MSPQSVAEKLRVKPGMAIWTSSPDLLALIGPLPADTSNAANIGEADVALLFAERADTLRRLLDETVHAVHSPAVMWIAYPKAGKSDLKRDTIPPHLTLRDMIPIGQVAIDDVWSALRFRPRKPGEAPFKGGGRSG